MSRITRIPGVLIHVISLLAMGVMAQTLTDAGAASTWMLFFIVLCWAGRFGTAAAAAKRVTVYSRKIFKPTTDYTDCTDRTYIASVLSV